MTERFGIKENERKPLLSLMAHAFCNGAALALYDTFANSLFLSRFEESKLPYTFMASALVLICLGWIYNRIEKKLRSEVLFFGTMLSMVLAFVVIYIARSYSDANFLIFAMMVFKSVGYALIGLEFWTLASRVFNIRQSKYLFGLLVAGEVSAELVISLLVPFVISGPGQLGRLLLMGIFFLLTSTLILVFFIYPLIKVAISSSPSEEPCYPSSTKQLLKVSFVRIFLALSALSFLVEYLIEYIFCVGIKQHYSTEFQIARFYGMYNGVLGLTQLFFGLFLSGPLIRRFGLRFGLSALPSTNLFNTIGLLCSSTFGFLTPIPFFIVVTRIGDLSVRSCIEGPTARILYQAISAKDRMKLRTLRETTIDPFAAIVAGAVLILFASSTSSIPKVLVLVTICSIGMLYLGFMLYRIYPRELSKTMDARKQEDLQLNFDHPESMAVIRSALESNVSSQVIYCLSILEKMGHASYVEALGKLISSPHEVVVEFVLRQIEAKVFVVLAPQVRRCLESTQNAKIKGLAIRAYCAVTDSEQVADILPYLQDSNPQLKTAATVGLLKSGGIDGILAAGEELSILLKSEKPKLRLRGAVMLGETGITNLYRPLVNLLRDSNIEVRMAAIRASSKLKNVRLLPFLFEQYSIPHLRTAIAYALKEYGDEAVPKIVEAFEQKMFGNTSGRRLIKLFEKTKSDVAVKALFRILPLTEASIKSQVAEALVSSQFQAKGEELAQVNKLLQVEVKLIAWLAGIYCVLNDKLESSVLLSALTYEMDRVRKRVMALLYFAHASKNSLSAYNGLMSLEPDRRAKAVEVMEGHLSSHLKRSIIAVIEDLDIAERSKKLQLDLPQNLFSPKECLIELALAPLDNINAWTKACALFAIGNSPLEEFRNAIIQNLDCSHSLVRETAVWALYRLDKAYFISKRSRFLEDTSTAVNTLTEILSLEIEKELGLKNAANG